VWLNTACFLAFAGIWIEKGMGMIIPAFIPSALHEIVEYRPSLTEWKVTAGIWALGFMIYTLLLKITINVYSRNMRDAQGQRTIESKDALAFGEHI
jgi:molybdopterin-containing oxidoreductase family membrane subunit